MDKAALIKIVVDQLKEAGIVPAFVSEPTDVDIIVRLRDPRPPFTKNTVKITGEELDRYARSEPTDKVSERLAEVARMRVRHVLHQLESQRPVELAAAARRQAEGL